MKIPISRWVDIPDQRIKDLLCCAIEGGCGHWCGIKDYIIASDADTSTVEYKHLDLPFIEGCGVLVHDTTDATLSPVLIDCVSIESGLKDMAEDYPVHFDNFMKENEDAETGNVFMQCCVFGEVIYE